MNSWVVEWDGKRQVFNEFTAARTLFDQVRVHASYASLAGDCRMTKDKDDGDASKPYDPDAVGAVSEGTPYTDGFSDGMERTLELAKEDLAICRNADEHDGVGMVMKSVEAEIAANKKASPNEKWRGLTCKHGNDAADCPKCRAAVK